MVVWWFQVFHTVSIPDTLHRMSSKVLDDPAYNSKLQSCDFLVFSAQKSAEGPSIRVGRFCSNPVRFLCWCVNGMSALSSLDHFLTSPYPSSRIISERVQQTAKYKSLNVL